MAYLIGGHRDLTGSANHTRRRTAGPTCARLLFFPVASLVVSGSWPSPLLVDARTARSSSSTWSSVPAVPNRQRAERDSPRYHWHKQQPKRGHVTHLQQNTFVDTYR